LAGRKLTALPRLRALRELDLEVVGVREIHARDAEPAGSHLFDGAAPVRVEQALDVFTALARVRAAPDPVHRDRERLVRLARDRSVTHRAGGEALHDRGDGFDLVDGNGGARTRPER